MLLERSPPNEPLKGLVERWEALLESPPPSDDPLRDRHVATAVVRGLQGDLAQSLVLALLTQYQVQSASQVRCAETTLRALLESVIALARSRSSLVAELAPIEAEAGPAGVGPEAGGASVGAPLRQAVLVLGRKLEGLTGEAGLRASKTRAAAALRLADASEVDDLAGIVAAANEILAAHAALVEEAARVLPPPPSSEEGVPVEALERAWQEAARAHEEALGAAMRATEALATTPPEDLPKALRAKDSQNQAARRAFEDLQRRARALDAANQQKQSQTLSRGREHALRTASSAGWMRTIEALKDMTERVRGALDAQTRRRELLTAGAARRRLEQAEAVNRRVRAVAEKLRESAEALTARARAADETIRTDCQTACRAIRQELQEIQPQAAMRILELVDEHAQEAAEVAKRRAEHRLLHEYSAELLDALLGPRRGGPEPEGRPAEDAARPGRGEKAREFGLVHEGAGRSV